MKILIPILLALLATASTAVSGREGFRLQDGDRIKPDPLLPDQAIITDIAGTRKGVLKRDWLFPDRIDLYDEYGLNRKGSFRKDPLMPGTYIFRKGWP